MYVTDYIKPDNLKDAYLYRIIARNAVYGIWIAKNGAFLISRVKFGSVYLFEEIHYDLDEQFGTAQPIQEIGKSPFDSERLQSIDRIKGDREVLQYLMAKSGIDEKEVEKRFLKQPWKL